MCHVLSCNSLSELPNEFGEPAVVVVAVVCGLARLAVIAEDSDRLATVADSSAGAAELEADEAAGAAFATVGLSSALAAARQNKPSAKVKTRSFREILIDPP